MLSLFRKRAATHVHRQMSIYTNPSGMGVVLRMYGTWVFMCTLTFGCAPSIQPDEPLGSHIKKNVFGWGTGALVGVCTPLILCSGAFTDVTKTGENIFDRVKQIDDHEI